MKNENRHKYPDSYGMEFRCVKNFLVFPFAPFSTSKNSNYTNDECKGLESYIPCLWFGEEIVLVVDNQLISYLLRSLSLTLNPFRYKLRTSFGILSMISIWNRKLS